MLLRSSPPAGRGTLHRSGVARRWGAILAMTLVVA